MIHKCLYWDYVHDTQVFYTGIMFMIHKCLYWDYVHDTQVFILGLCS